MSDRKCNQSVIKCLKILECFTEEKNELKLTEISRMLNIPKSTTYNFLYTLESMGYVVQNEQTGKYNLGSMLMVLASRSEAHFDLRNVLFPFLEKLHDEFNETFNATTWFNSSGLIVGSWLLKVSTTSSLAPSRELGSKMPLHSTASGKVFLAYAPADLRESTLASIELTPFTANTITNKDVLLCHLNEVRQQGYAVALDEEDMGIISISAPVFDNYGRVVACLSTGVPTVRAPEKRMNEIRSRIVEYARQASLKFRGGKFST